MSLVVWLPLTKDLRQQGLSNATVSIMRGNETWDNNGKLGKCFYANGVNTLQINNIIPQLYNTNGYSLCAWFYIESQNTVHSGAGIVSGGNWNSQVLNLSVSDWSSDHYTRLRVSGTNWNNTYTYNFYKNIWYHAVVCSDGNKTYAYINGQLIGDTVAGFLPSSIEGNNIAIGGATYYSGMQFFGKINDVRIYDHCLSPMEVKELAKGLVLHYPLNRQGWGQENFILESHKVTGGGNASGITRTYESDGSMKIVSTSGNGNWCSLSFAKDSNTNVGNNMVVGDTYCISCDVKIETGTVLPTLFINNGNGYKQLRPINGSIVTGQWIRVYYNSTWAEPGTSYGNISLHLGFGSAIGTYYFKNFKLEKGSIPTHWCPNTTDSNNIGLNSTTEYDCSGFCNNGTRTGTFTWTSDTPKYQVSTVFNGTQRIEAPWNPSGTTSFSVSGWFYHSGGTTYYAAKDTYNTYIDLEGSRYFVYNSSASAYVGNWSSVANTWQHIVLVHDATITKLKLYINGNFVSEVATNGTIYNSNILDIGGRQGVAQYSGKMSDFRIYATALSADDVKSLYQNSAYIDSGGNVYGAVHSEV